MGDYGLKVPSPEPEPTVPELVHLSKDKNSETFRGN
jgi:hypothetical protein